MKEKTEHARGARIALKRLSLTIFLSPQSDGNPNCRVPSITSAPNFGIAKHLLFLRALVNILFKQRRIGQLKKPRETAVFDTLS